MSWVMAGAAAVSLAPSAFKAIKGINQNKQANKISTVNPGYQLNNGVINNARLLSDRASNYQMPGYGQAKNNLDTSYSNAFSTGIQGATSGGDVLDLATKLAYGQGQQNNSLALNNAQGADKALMQSLDANASAGEQYQLQNEYDRQEYEKRLREKAALKQAGQENIYGALDQAAFVGSSFINPTKGMGTKIS